MQYFTMVVKHQSFSRAAKASHISQPSLSNAIKALEDDLKGQLIERTTKKFQLTELGQQFYTQATYLLHQFDLLEKETKEMAQGENLTIRLGMIESANYWFSQVMLEYKVEFPHNRITLIDTLYNQTVREALLNLSVHGVITNQHIVDHEIKSELLYNEPYVALMHDQHPFKNKEALTLADFEHEPLIIGMHQFQTSAQILKAFAEENITPHIHYEIERFEMIKVLVEKQLGITILPKHYVSQHISHKLITRPITSHHLNRNVYLCTMKNRTFPKSIERLFLLIKHAHN